MEGTKGMTVNEETLRVLGKELPWVIQFIPSWAKWIHVSIIDLNILSLQREGQYHDQMILFDSKGEFIRRVGSKPGTAYETRFIWSLPFIIKHAIGKEERFTESVEKAIKRIGERAWEARYVVHIRPDGMVEIYKLSKLVKNLREQLDKKAEEAFKELHSALNG